MLTMTRANVQETETLLLETLMSALDARESARRGGSTMLVYFADMMVRRTREELEELRTSASVDPNAPRSYSPSLPTEKAGE